MSRVFRLLVGSLLTAIPFALIHLPLAFEANGLHGTKFELPYPSVGATEQVLLTAVRAEGVTELRNAAIEPEIIDLICVLQKMGAIITVHTDRVIEIQGVSRLHGYHHRPVPDRRRPVRRARPCDRRGTRPPRPRSRWRSGAEPTTCSSRRPPPP